jgi:hypothetical protein
VVEDFDCFVFAILLLDFFSLLLAMMIVLSFVPAVVYLLMNAQVNTLFFVACLFGYHPNDQSH